MGRPLSGYRIVDTTAMVSGPVATMVLADQGAEVLKIERPDVGDYTRLASNRRNGFSASFVNNNRNKRSVALNLKHERGLAALKRLCAGADVFVQNFRPGVAERMGIGETAIRAVAPDIVYVSISGFGEAGPYAAQPVYDPLVQALSGLASIQGGADHARPRLVRTIVPDKLTGYIAAQAITAALLARAGGAPGQHVRVSMLAAVLDFLWHSDMNSQTFVDEQLAQADAASFIDLIYATRDGYISVAVQTDAEWQALIAALDAPELNDDPRFATAAARQDNIDARLAITQDKLAVATSGYWLGRLAEYDVPCAPVLTRSQVIDNAQIAANGIVLETNHPEAGRLRQARPAAAFSRAGEPVYDSAPALGADTAAVLAEHGYGAEQIDALIDAGAAARPRQNDNPP